MSGDIVRDGSVWAASCPACGGDPCWCFGESDDRDEGHQMGLVQSGWQHGSGARSWVEAQEANPNRRKRALFGEFLEDLVTWPFDR